MTNLVINDVRPRAYLEQSEEGNKRFDFAFPILSAADLRITVDDGEINASSVTVNGVGQSEGGYILLDTAPDVGTKVTIWRDMAFERTTDFVEDGDFRASAINEELDRMAMLLQQADALADDALHHAPEDAEADTAFQLPNATDRANKVLGFDASGNPIVVLTDADAAAAAAASAAQAEASAASAASSADSASQALLSAGTPLDKTLNLSDLPDAATARSNIDVASTGEIDAIISSSNAVDKIARANVALNGFRIAVMDGFSILNLVDGVLDPFEDETGIDETLSSGQTFISSDGIFTTSPWFEHDPSGNTKIGDMTGGGGLSAVFDGDTSTTAQQTTSSSDTTTGEAGLDLGAGNEKAFGRASLSGRENTSGSVSWSYWGNRLTRVAIEGSQNNSTWTTIATSPDFFDGGGFNDAGTRELYFIDNATAYRYWRAVCGIAGTTDGPMLLSSLRFFEQSTPIDIDLISVASTADAVPGEARVIVVHEALEAITLGTDVKVYASRETGVTPTWAEGAISELTSFESGLTVLEAVVDLSAQASQASMRWRVETLNTKKQNLHGVAIQWN